MRRGTTTTSEENVIKITHLQNIIELHGLETEAYVDIFNSQSSKKNHSVPLNLFFKFFPAIYFM